MTDDCGHPAPDEIRIHPEKDAKGEPRPGWYVVQIGMARAHGDVLDIVSPVLQKSLDETGTPARAVTAGDREDPDCGHTWSEIHVRPAEPDEDAEPDVFTDL